MTILDQLKPSRKDNGEQQPRLGDLAKKQQPAGRPMRAPSHDDYAEEAKRAAQRYLDQVDHIDLLNKELADWRNRCLLAEAEVDQLKLREHDLIAKNEGLMHDLAEIRTHYTVAGKIWLDGLAVINKAESEAINLKQIGTEITATPTNDEPLPSVVRKGPEQP